MADERLDEMASTMKAAAIAEMCQELLDAGYSVRLQVRGSYVSLPFDENADIGAVIIQSYNNDKDGLIKYAYQHLEAKRRLEALEAENAAMKAFIGEIARNDPNEEGEHIREYVNWIEGARELVDEDSD